MEGLLDLAAKNGLKTVAFIYEDTLFPKTSVRGAMASARKRGLEIVFLEAYPKAQTDFAALLTKIRAVRPDVLAAATYFDDVVAITRQMKDLDVNVKMFGTTVGGDLPEFYKALGRTGEYVYGASQWEPSLTYPGAHEFAATYEAEFSRPPPITRPPPMPPACCWPRPSTAPAASIPSACATTSSSSGPPLSSAASTWTSAAIRSAIAW